MQQLLKYLAVFVLGLGAIQIASASYSPSSIPAYGEMYLNDNSTSTVIDTVDATHLLTGVFTAGALEHFSFVAGTTDDDISAYATYDSGASTLVTAATTHELSAGNYIAITGTTNYNELYEVLSVPSTVTFEIDKAWDGNDDGQGTFARGDALIANGQSAGDYAGDHYLASVAAANNDTFEAYTVINGNKCTKCITKRKYAVGADYGVTSGHALATGFQDGTTIQFGIENTVGTGDFTAQYGNVRLVRQ